MNRHCTGPPPQYNTGSVPESKSGNYPRFWNLQQGSHPLTVTTVLLLLSKVIFLCIVGKPYLRPYISFATIPLHYYSVCRSVSIQVSRYNMTAKPITMSQNAAAGPTHGFPSCPIRSPTSGCLLTRFTPALPPPTRVACVSVFSLVTFSASLADLFILTWSPEKHFGRIYQENDNRGKSCWCASIFNAQFPLDGSCYLDEWSLTRWGI